MKQTLVAPSHHISQLFPAFVSKNIKNPRLRNSKEMNNIVRETYKDDVEKIKWSNFLIRLS